MTPEQQAAIKRAEALARAEAAAAADQGPSADELTSGVSSTDTGTYTTAQQAVNQAKGALRDTGEGLVKGTLDVLPAVAQGIMNIPGRLNNSLASNANQYAPEVDPEAMQKAAPAPVALMDRDTTAIGSGPYNKLFPPDPEHPERRKIFNIAGELAPAIVMPELLAGRFNALKTGADLAGQTALTYGGGEGGEALDKALGGDGSKGRFAGSVLSGLTFPAVREAAISAGRKMWVDPLKSPGRAAQAERLGVDRDLSLLGNESAAAAGKGRGFDELRNRQQTQIDAAIKREANRVAGDPNVDAPGPIAKGDIGKNTAEVATIAAERAQADADRIYDPMTKAVEDKNFVVDQGPIRQTIKDLREHRDFSVIQKPTVDYYDRVSKADSKFPVDQALEQTLLAQRKKVEAMQPLTPTAERFKQQQLDDLDAKLADNKGASWRATQTAKKESGDALEKSGGVHRRTEGVIHEKGHDAALSKSAANAGYNTPGVDDYKAVEQQFGWLKDDETALDKVAKADAPEAYNQVFSPTNEQDAFALQRLALHTSPTELAQIMSQNLEFRGRGPAVAGRPELPDQMGLRRSAPDWWASVPEDSKKVMVRDPRARANIDAAMNLSKLEQRRGGMSQVDPIENFPAKSIAAAGVLTGNIPLAVGHVVPRTIGRMAGGLLRSPRVTDRLIRGNEGLTPSDLARIMVAGVAGAN